ncbi:unnamed protein product [Gadus morhua 'NCC']
MSRRSARLVSGGYYQSDEDSDSSSVTTISYRESPLRVFKKKPGGTRKASTRTSSRANSNVSSVSTAEPSATERTNQGPEQYQGPTPEPAQGGSSIQMVLYNPTPAPTARPALTPARGRSRTPTPCPDAPPESSLPSGSLGPFRAGGLQGSYSRLLNQASVDSSGYSSAEGPHRRPTTTTSPTHPAPRTPSGEPASPPGGTGTSKAHSSSRSYSYYTDRLLRPGMRTLIGGVLLLALLFLCVYLLVPLLVSLTLHPTTTKATGPGLTTITTPPVSLTTPPPPALPPSSSPPHHQATPPPASPLHHQATAPPPLNHPAPQPCSVPPAPAALDPLLVSAAVDHKMQNVLEELLQKQENLHSLGEARLRAELQVLRARLEELGTAGQQSLEAEVDRLSRLLARHQADADGARTAMALRVRALETTNTQLSEELSSIQKRPAPAPCPVPEPPAPQDQSLLSPQLQHALEEWLADRIQEHELSASGSCTDCNRPMADKMADFALESQGASVVSTRCSETYSIGTACVTLFGFPLWYPSESPRTVIQGYAVLLPGRCWAFRGVQGTLVLALSHPVAISHVTLDHLPRYSAPTGRIDSAPRDFQVYGMQDTLDEATLLGNFTYDQEGESAQTFTIPESSSMAFRHVELRVLSNWGHMTYTCIYRFRVHGKMADA